jgi:hypothetical protein
VTNAAPVYAAAVYSRLSSMSGGHRGRAALLVQAAVELHAAAHWQLMRSRLQQHREAARLWSSGALPHPEPPSAIPTRAGLREPQPLDAGPTAATPRPPSSLCKEATTAAYSA